MESHDKLFAILFTVLALLGIAAIISDAVVKSNQPCQHGIAPVISGQGE